MEIIETNKEVLDLAEEQFETYAQNPELFFTDVLNVELWSKQKEILQSVLKNKKTTVRSCHSVGKTFTTSRIALWFLYSHMPSVVITTAPTARQIKNQFWRELRSAHGRATFPLGGHLMKTQLDLDEDWFAIGLLDRDWETDGI